MSGRDINFFATIKFDTLHLLYWLLVIETHTADWYLSHTKDTKQIHKFFSLHTEPIQFSERRWGWNMIPNTKFLTDICTTTLLIKWKGAYNYYAVSVVLGPTLTIQQSNICGSLRSSQPQTEPDGEVDALSGEKQANVTLEGNLD